MTNTIVYGGVLPDNTKKNINYIILYGLTLATSLGFNNLVVSLFGRFNKVKSRVYANIIYFLLMFCITIFIAYKLKQTLN
jgi:hypothetical protein